MSVISSMCVCARLNEGGWVGGCTCVYVCMHGVFETSLAVCACVCWVAGMVWVRGGHACRWVWGGYGCVSDVSVVCSFVFYVRLVWVGACVGG